MNTNTYALQHYKVSIYEKQLDGNDCKLTILKCDYNCPNPKEYMDDVVTVYMEGKRHNQFVEINLDIPQIRVIIENLNELKFQSVR